MICLSRALAKVASVPARNPCGHSRSAPGSLTPAARLRVRAAGRSRAVAARQADLDARLGRTCCGEGQVRARYRESADARVNADEFPAERAGESDQQQSAIAQVGEIVGAGGDQLAHLGGGRRGRAPDDDAVAASDAAERGVWLSEREGIQSWPACRGVWQMAESGRPILLLCCNCGRWPSRRNSGDCLWCGGEGLHPTARCRHRAQGRGGRAAAAWPVIPEGSGTMAGARGASQELR